MADRAEQGVAAEDALEGLDPILVLRRPGGAGSPQMFPTASEILAAACGEEAVVSDADEAVGEDVAEEAAGKDLATQSEGLGFVSVSAVLVAEDHLGAIVGEDARVRDCDAVDVSGEIADDVVWSPQGRLDVDVPGLLRGALSRAKPSDSGKGIEPCRRAFSISWSSLPRKTSRREWIGRKNLWLVEIQLEWLRASPPAGTTQWMWGWKRRS